jgi:Na+/H+-translocating membrane pyrophosphatase
MMLALMMANAGGAWDNAKKYIEIEGASGGKVSQMRSKRLRTNSR